MMGLESSVSARISSGHQAVAGSSRWTLGGGGAVSRVLLGKKTALEARSRRSIPALATSLIQPRAEGRGTPCVLHPCSWDVISSLFVSPPSPHGAKPHCHAYKSQEQRVARFLPRPCGLKAGTKAVQFQASPAEATLLTWSGDRGGAREQVGGRPILRILLQVLARREGALRCAGLRIAAHLPPVPCPGWATSPGCRWRASRR